ncbi:flagellar motor protein MotB [Kistimonas scapharcae]|uniref:flagellar motor protein MotB n=1 Tax=Kistimonas scapharcae TaxID=1036133 RepID=UPI0031EA4BD7
MSEHPLIIKRVVHVSHGGHHGGSWKVAFADFAIAMMALFLVLWLVAATNRLQKEVIADYFSNPGMFKHPSSDNPIRMEGATSVHQGAPTPVRAKATGYEGFELAGNTAPGVNELNGVATELSKVGSQKGRGGMRSSYKVERIPNGLILTIPEINNEPMFLAGKSDLTYLYEDLFLEMAPILSKLPNKMIISGHTDATPWSPASSMDNWKLSANRADTVRRTLVFGGMPENKVLQVVGMADQAPLQGFSPEDQRNRRIEIMVLSRKSAGYVKHAMQKKADFDLPAAQLEQAIDKAKANQIAL